MVADEYQRRIKAMKLTDCKYPDCYTCDVALECYRKSDNFDKQLKQIDKSFREEFEGNMINEFYMDGDETTNISESTLIDLLCAAMPNCKGYDIRYCDKYMCVDCSKSNANVRTEYLKMNNICIKCMGHTTSCLNRENMFIEKLCNQCGGTGKFYT